MDIGKFVVERVESIYALDPADDSLLFILDEPTQGSLESAMETVWAEGKGGRRLYGLDNSKTATFTASNGYLVTAALAAQTGSAVTNIADVTGGVSVPVIEYIRPAGGTLTLTYTPVAGTVKYIYEANSDLTQGKKIDVSANGKTITIPQDSTATLYIVTYDRNVTTGNVIPHDSETYTKNAKVVFTILCHEACDMNTAIYTLLVFPNAKIDGNFTLDISGDAVVQEISIEAMADVCDVDKVYWRWFFLD